MFVSSYNRWTHIRLVLFVYEFLSYIRIYWKNWILGSLVGCLLFVDLRSWSLKSPDRHAFFCVFCNLMSENQLGFCVCSCCFSCYRCCFFGDVSSKRDPQAYLGHVRGLYDNFLGEHYKFYEKQALPLIINTPGWVKGILLFVSFEAFTIVMCLMLELVLLFVFFFSVCQVLVMICWLRCWSTLVPPMLCKYASLLRVRIFQKAHFGWMANIMDPFIW